MLVLFAHQSSDINEHKEAYYCVFRVLWKCVKSSRTTCRSQPSPVETMRPVHYFASNVKKWGLMASRLPVISRTQSLNSTPQRALKRMIVKYEDKLRAVNMFPAYREARNVLLATLNLSQCTFILIYVALGIAQCIHYNVRTPQRQRASGTSLRPQRLALRKAYFLRMAS